MLIIICAMLPSSIILPHQDLSLSNISLNSSWQIHGLIISSLLFGPQIGATCAITYIIIGLFYLPVFHGGGSVGYILTHEFGYLLGFIPSALVCGFLSKRESNANLINYSLISILSLCMMHIIGITYLVFGKIIGNWIGNLYDLVLINTFIPFPTQLLLCLPISLIAILIKRILFIK